MIQRTMFVLAVNDLARTSTYYRDLLGFSIREIGDDGWRIFERDQCRIMAGHCPDASPALETGDHSYFAYIVVDNADDYFDEFKARNVEFIKTIVSEPWNMREFGIRTIDGHRIMFAHELS